ncbi:MAG: tRNA-dihydrouridine synthase family protein [Bacteroidales bacterium]|nr:tRNA-dihydrouridine synthase family protein [Bacteroidales bacterium]
MLILAPMQGLTELMFRKVYQQCFPGAFDLAVSPFLSLTHGNLADAWKKIDDVLPEANRDSIPVIPQILGKEPQEFVGLANRLYEIGYTEVNWNIGCPMRRVAAKHRGSGILPYPNEIQSLLEQVVPQLKPQLSIKMRLGHNSPQEIFAIIPILNEYPLANVTIHPRTGRQQYGGQVDLDTFERVLPLLHHRIVYNGDICTLADYHRITSRFPQIRDFMIGRGVLYDPLLPLHIKEEKAETGEEELQQSVRFILALLDAIGEGDVRDESKMRKVKEYWCLVRRSLPITEQQALAVLHAQDYGSTLERVHEILRIVNIVA